MLRPAFVLVGICEIGTWSLARAEVWGSWMWRIIDHGGSEFESKGRTAKYDVKRRELEVECGYHTRTESTLKSTMREQMDGERKLWQAVGSDSKAK